MSTNLERSNLEAHVDLCAERYKRLEEKFQSLESRLGSLESKLTDMDAKSDLQIAGLKNLISEGQSSKFRVLVSTAGTIVAALLGTLGYLIVKK